MITEINKRHKKAKEEEHIGSRGKIKGAASVKGESKMDQGRNKM